MNQQGKVVAGEEEEEEDTPVPTPNTAPKQDGGAVFNGEEIEEEEEDVQPVAPPKELTRSLSVEKNKGDNTTENRSGELHMESIPSDQDLSKSIEQNLSEPIIGLVPPQIQPQSTAQKRTVEKNENLRRNIGNKLLQFFHQTKQELHHVSVDLGNSLNLVQDISQNLSEVNENLLNLSNQLSSFSTPNIILSTELAIK